MKTETKIYHNPRCSKSRETLALLRAEGVEPTVVEYLTTPPTAQDLREIVQLLKLRPRDIVRTKEAAFESLKLDLEDDDAVLTALARHPALIERPIVVRGKKAAIGRPPENVRNLL